MRHPWAILTSIGFAAAIAAFSRSNVDTPKTDQQPVTDVVHGLALTDPYRWLEDQQSTGTRAWIASQQKYTAGYFAAQPGRDEVHKHLAELMRIDRYNLPTSRNSGQFFVRYPADKDENQLCIRNGANAKEEILVDANRLSSPGHPMTVRLEDVSTNGEILLYGIQDGGEDEVTPHLFRVKTRTDQGQVLPKARYSGFSLLPDASGFYYSKLLPEGVRLFFHQMNSRPENDRLVFGEGYGAKWFVSGDATYDGRWLVATASTGWGVKSDIYVKRQSADTKLQPLITNLDGEFLPSYFDDHLYVLTTWKSPNRRILSIDLNHPDRANWKEIVPEKKDHIQSASIFGGKLVVQYLHDVTSELKIFNLDGKLDRGISLPMLGTVTGVRGEPDRNEMFFGFSSFTYPVTEFQYDLSSGKQSVWWKVENAPRMDDFVTEQVWYESRDKTKIPMFIVHRKQFARDGKARALMTAYGGFDVSLTPVYEPQIAYWIEQGGVFALPNLRGGGEFGEAWHRAGMFQNKQNVFDDFEAAAEYLEKNGYTRASRLGIYGTSNGGLLMGAAVTQRPALFGAVVCRYPLLDMVRYDRFKVAQWWTAEYGSAENKDQFTYLSKYSPYHHVEKGVKYPAVLFVTGDRDTRVDPLHARKMTALMQASTGSDQPILLKYDTASGHSGGRPLSVDVDDETDFMLFLKHELQ